jgi:hypothetical protein
MIARVALFALLAWAAAPVVADDAKAPAKADAKQDRFEQFKQLVGEWVGKGPGEDGKAGHDMTVKYKLTSGGSAIVETIGEGTNHEMVTLIHPDGDDILLTHYCMLGNQPQMKAPGKGEGNKVEFTFVKATNLKSDKDMYMHNVTFTFVDKDNLKAEWTHYLDGKPAGSVTFELKRKK